MQHFKLRVLWLPRSRSFGRFLYLISNIPWSGLVDLGIRLVNVVAPSSIPYHFINLVLQFASSFTQSLINRFLVYPQDIDHGEGLGEEIEKVARCEQ